MNNKRIYLKEEIKKNKTVTPEEIINCVCNLYNVTPEQIRSKTRKKEVRNPRQILCFLIRKYIKFDNVFGEKKDISLQKVGDALCKNHATVVHSLRVIKNSCDTDKEFKSEIEKVEVIVSNLFVLENNVQHLDISQIVDMLPKNGQWSFPENRETYINCSYELFSYGLSKESISKIIKNLYQAAKYEQ